MFIGFIIIAIGVVYLCNTINPDLNLQYSLIIFGGLFVGGILDIIKNRHVTLFNAVIIFTGGWLFANEFGLIPDGVLEFFWPILIIVVGLIVVWNTISFNRKKKEFRTDKKGYANFHAFFSGVDEKVTDKNLKGIVVNSVFGGSDLDLTELEFKGNEFYIEMTSVFGGSEVRLPKNCKLVFNSTAIFGGDENKYHQATDDTAKTIYINSQAIFGGNSIY